MPRFQSAEAYAPTKPDWELLPFQFERFGDDRVLLTNMVGEHAFVSDGDFEALLDKTLRPDEAVTRRLRGRHFLRERGDGLPLELLALKTRTRYHRLAQFTGLHMFVVSLRCDHSCPYCQVSRQSADKHRFDMSAETAERALELVFRSPSPFVKIEFQGGETLLNNALIRKIVSDAKAINEIHGKDLAFVIATNLALLDDDVLAFCAEHDIHISTSLDGPADLHNKNRPRPDGDSWERAIAGIRRVREVLGPDRVSALMTTTEASLGRAKEIIDIYVAEGLMNVFLRPLSPYGFAVKTKSHAAYDVDRWLAFYEEGLEYILDLNRAGLPVVEQYAAIVLKKMLTNEDPGYVDLASPARIGIGALVYNYDGDVYASDEGRMLAEMGDQTFRLGNVHEDSYEALLLSDALLEPLEQSFSGSAPMCSECAFEPFCGSDPVFHHATMGDAVGRKPLSAFCKRNMRIFRLLLERYEQDEFAREVFLGWSGR
jgi:His-Xaa-Ser system radical SAM maturase HxsB